VGWETRQICCTCWGSKLLPCSLYMAKERFPGLAASPLGRALGLACSMPGVLVTPSAGTHLVTPLPLCLVVISFSAAGCRLSTAFLTEACVFQRGMRRQRARRAPRPSPLGDVATSRRQRRNNPPFMDGEQQGKPWRPQHQPPVSFLASTPSAAATPAPAYTCFWARFTPSACPGLLAVARLRPHIHRCMRLSLLTRLQLPRVMDCLGQRGPGAGCRAVPDAAVARHRDGAVLPQASGPIPESLSCGLHGLLLEVHPPCHCYPHATTPLQPSACQGSESDPWRPCQTAAWEALSLFSTVHLWMEASSI